MLINIVSINLTINLFVTLILIYVCLRYYCRLCPARSLNMYWITICLKILNKNIIEHQHLALTVVAVI